jgi:geranylgeranyl pyrophosphate synthase
MNASYGLLARASTAQLAASLIEDATRCIGSDGMIGGQMVDLELKGRATGEAALASRNLKTTALLELTMTAGARSVGASESDIAALREFGEALGMAYQICDDLLDELGESQQTGKPARQDARHARASYVVELGCAEAHQHARAWVDAGKLALRRQFDERVEADWLIEAAEQIIHSVKLPRPTLLLPPCSRETFQLALA